MSQIDEVIKIYEHFWASGFKTEDHEFYVNAYIPKELHFLCSQQFMERVYKKMDKQFNQWIEENEKSIAAD